MILTLIVADRGDAGMRGCGDDKNCFVGSARRFDLARRVIFAAVFERQCFVRLGVSRCRSSSRNNQRALLVKIGDTD